jgi:hypothetical protein
MPNNKKNDMNIQQQIRHQTRKCRLLASRLSKENSELNRLQNLYINIEKSKIIRRYMKQFDKKSDTILIEYDSELFHAVMHLAGFETPYRPKTDIKIKQDSIEISYFSERQNKWHIL